VEALLGPTRREDRPFGPCPPRKALIESALVVCGEVSVRFRARQAFIVLVIAAAAAAALVIGAPSAAAAVEVRPDLGMARLHSLRITNQYGMRLLRFGTDIVNIGSGRFEVYGAGSASADWGPSQHIFRDDGTYRIKSVPTTMFYAGDGHDHRHVKDLLKMELTSLAGGTDVRRVKKIGYCFYDNVRYRLSLPGAPQSAFYRSNSCGRSSSTSARMGISIGWGDRYPWDIAYQYVDISGLAAGNYRLTVTADPANWFDELYDTNNETWVELYIARPGYSSRILRYGPSA
jgi:hypothetical protein